MIDVKRQDKAMQLTIASEKLTKDMHIGDISLLTASVLPLPALLRILFR